MLESRRPKIDPNRPLAAQAVMNVGKSKEIAGAWITPHVPQTRLLLTAS